MLNCAYIYYVTAICVVLDFTSKFHTFNFLFTNITLSCCENFMLGTLEFEESSRNT